jgi:topoisomerase IA-like protein
MKNHYQPPPINLGLFNDLPVYLKTGKYGPYIEHHSFKMSTSKINKNEITLNDIIPFIENHDYTRHVTIPKNILRIINSDISIKKGKYGPYIYYKTIDMKIPQFYSLSNFNKGYLKCDIEDIKSWLKTNHNLLIE